MIMPGRGGLTASERLPNPSSFAQPVSHSEGNDLPAVSSHYGSFRDGPHPPTQHQGGQLGANDGFWGSNNAPNRQCYPPLSTHTSAWSEGDSFQPEVEGHQSFRRYGLQGFNDKLRVVDRHVYWDTGSQLQGTDFTPASSPPNTYNNPLQNPPVHELRTVNRSITYQRGSDKSRNEDDLARPYTWVGEQGSGWAPVYGGTPGLYLPYGSRGGVPYPLVGPELGQTGDGRQIVFAGPPHGLHSLTYPNNADTLQRYQVNPQMRPVRFDRPSNSPQAGQSFNQTVVPQGGVPVAKKPGPWASRVPGRGWKGTPS